MADLPAPTEKPDLGEKTRGQGVYHPTSDVAATMLGQHGIDAIPGPGMRTWREMLTDPTVALGMAVIKAPILSGSWSIESKDDTPEDRIEFIQEIIEPMRRHILTECLRALDFGWSGFEKIFELRDGRYRLRRLKPLYHDATGILIDKDTGRFEGFRQNQTTLGLEKALLYTFDREGDNYYGRPRLEGARKPWAWWDQTNETAARYDKKAAGTIIVIHYPPGQTRDKSGQLVENYKIAEKLLQTMVSAKGVVVPNEFAAFTDDRDGATAEKRKWLIELIDAKGGMQASFKDRLTYLDSLKMRGLLRSERSALEAQTGGLGSSDTAEMQDLGLTDCELIHQSIVETINWHVIDQLLALNFGDDARGTVYITPAPLRDSRLAIVRNLIDKWASNPDGREDLRLWLDFDAVVDMAGLPKAAEVIGQDDDDTDPVEPVPGADVTDPAADEVRQLFRQQGA